MPLSVAAFADVVVVILLQLKPLVPLNNHYPFTAHWCGRAEHPPLLTMTMIRVISELHKFKISVFKRMPSVNNVHPRMEFNLNTALPNVNYNHHD